jgi:prophage regulatory protein
LSDQIRILRRPEAERLTGLCSRQLDQLEARGDFPRRVPLGGRVVGWIDAEVQGWIRARMALRTEAAVAEALRVARMPPGVRARWRREQELVDDAAPPLEPSSDRVRGPVGA